MIAGAIDDFICELDSEVRALVDDLVDETMAAEMTATDIEEYMRLGAEKAAAGAEGILREECEAAGERGYGGGEVAPSLVRSPCGGAER